ncbi:MAG: FG-GAP-like repeat-containing protein [Acidobacteriota bacterium]
MSRAKYPHTLSRVRGVRGALPRAVSVTLIIAMLSVHAPATPRPLTDLASELRSDFKFWSHSSGWAKTLRGLIGQINTPSPSSQEKQSDRDSKVASIKIFPGDVTIMMGDREFFGALAYDNTGAQVGGVKFTWRAEDLATTKAIKILQTGEFIAPALGSYKVTVEGAGKIAQVIVVVLEDINRPRPDAIPISVGQVSSRDKPSPAPGPLDTEPRIAVEEEPGPGWNASNFPAADDPENDVGDPPGRPLHHGAGSGNFQITAPILSLPGRGIDLSLGLTYNSRVWTLSNSEITYDIDRDWPAPGWSLGFGRVAGLGTGGAMLIDADGTRHGFAGTVTQYQGGYIGFTGRTIDGTFIDYNTFTDNTGTINYAQVSLPNGTIIQYGAPGRGAVYPQRITDANGNYISVHYRFNPERGPKILFITDTLGRTINFFYEQGALTAITAPVLSGGERQLVRLHYKTLPLSYGFSPTLTPNVDDPAPRVLDAIYYPGTGTGYWFGDADSYSSYGMLAKYSEQRGMGFSAPSLETQGTVTAGTITRQYVYNYPMSPDSSLIDAPAYTTMTETWDGMETAPAVTQYLLQKSGATRTTTITFPDLTKSVQLSHRTPGQYNDGSIYEDDTYDAGNNLLRKSTVTWAQGDYGSARPVRIEATDERNQMTAAEFSYELTPSYNQVTEVRDFDYGGINLLRTTSVQYRNAPEYINRHIFNLVKRVDVWNASHTVRVSRIDYNHDETTLANTPSVVQHNAAYDPYDPEFYDPTTNYRGNLTRVIRYADAANLTGAITETRTFDITGNVVTASTSCCEQMSLGYTSNTQFAFPETQTRGSADPTSPSRISTNAIYDFNTGLTTFLTDANGRQSQNSYFPNTLRPQTLTMPTLAYQSYTYDDSTMSITETVSALGGAIASQNTKLLNGLGQVKQESALGQNSVLDYVDTQYDAMGRTKKQTRPYRSGDTQQWTETFYDALGRVFRVLGPDGSESNSFFNETSRPSSASTSPGQTTRVVDAWGRERWARLDADARLAEVVEPNPAGNGSVGATGNMVTTYSYDTLGNLTLVNQGGQQRSFKYDSLNRLTHQKLAEEGATLNDSGQYVGAGMWSETFTYDERSNLITQTDARGVKTIYSYNSDPLNRLQSVTHDIDPSGDTAQHPILPAAGLTYEYVTSGDKTRLLKVTTTGVSTDEYGYDSEGRVSSRTLTMTSRPLYPMVTEYIYDTLNRVADVRYPAQYGMDGNPRKVAHQDYDVSSRLTGLKVDTADYAKDIVYNAASQTTSLKVGANGANQITESYTYAETTGLLSNQKVQRSGTSLMDLSYDYLRTGTTSGRTGQLTKILNNLNHNRDRGYEYDALGRLTLATGGQSANWTQGYLYDRYGNRSSVTVGRAAFDYDRDSKTDVAIYRPTNGWWYIVSSSTGEASVQAWGESADKPVPGDYDGDGKADVAVYRPSNGTWYIILSRTGSSTGVQWGITGDVAVPADYDGDGKTDVAIYRPSNGWWYIINSSTGAVTVRAWGESGDKPVPGDYDADGKADVAVYRPSNGTWYIILSTTGTSTGLQWGIFGDVPVSADYDGDGKTDVAIYRPSNGLWYIINSSTGAVTVRAWGESTDKPVPGDYDGDGKADVAVWRPSEGKWYIINSSTGASRVELWGISGDMPIPSTVSNTVNGGGSGVPRDGLASVSYDQATNRINTAGWEYDAAGNQTRAQRSDGSWQRYVYDAAGRLVKVQNDSGITQIIQTYGASNHRLIEQVGNESSNQRTYYGWAGDSVIAEYEETAAAPTTPRWVKSYIYLGGRLLATIAPNGGSERVEYHHPDRLGTRLVTNNQDTSSIEQAALPFGTALDAESSGATKRRFTSYDRSNVTGLDYAVNRHYDPLQGRFTQVDPIGMRSTSLSNPQTLNLYAYCSNDPINHTDPSGLGFFSFLGKIFGAIGKALHFVAKVLAVVAAVAAVVFLTWGMGWYALAFAVSSGILFASEYGPPIVGKILRGAGAVALRIRAPVIAGTPPINPNGGIGVGPISSFMQGPQIGPAPPDKTSWLKLFVDWVFSKGSHDRQFGPDSSMTEGLRTSPGIDPIRREFCAQIGSGGPPLLQGYTRFSLGWKIFGGPDGFLRAGLNMSRQFVGSFKLTIKGYPDGSALFTAENDTSLKSFLYHIPGVQPVKPGEGPGATMKQTYWWSETNPCGSR